MSEWTDADVEGGRFWSKVEKTETCWLWQGSRTPQGYGRYSDAGRLVQAHRWSYERLVGPIPDGLVIDHLCRVPACVNPAHLEPVTNRENVLRGTAGEVAKARQAEQTHCKWGHEFTPENTRYYRGGTQRRCRACERRRGLAYYHAKRAALLAEGRDRAGEGAGS